MPEVEDEGEGGVAGLPAKRGSVGRTRESGAELMGSSEGRGDVSGGEYGDRRQGTRSAIVGEDEGDEGESERG